MAAAYWFYFGTIASCRVGTVVPSDNGIVLILDVSVRTTDTVDSYT